MTIEYIVHLFKKGRILQKKDIFIIFGSIAGLTGWFLYSFGVPLFLAIEVAVVILISPVLFGVFIFVMAKLNCGWCFIQDNRVVAIKKGHSISAWLARITDKHIDRYDGKITPDIGNKKRSFVVRMLGAYWKGTPVLNKIHKWNSKWNEYTQDKDSTDLVIVSRSEKVDSLVVTKTFPILSHEWSKTTENIPLKVLGLVTIEFIHAGIALTGVDNWYTLFVGEIQEVYTEFIGSNNLENLIKSKGKGSHQSFLQALYNSNETKIRPATTRRDELVDKGLDTLCGLKIINFSLLSYSIDPDWEELTKKEYAAEQETLVQVQLAKQIELIAKADADKIERIGEATAIAEDKLYKARAKHDGAEIFALSDAIREAKPQSVVLGNALVRPTINVGHEKAK